MPYAVSVGILQYVQLSGQGVLRFEADPRGHPERTDYLRSWNDSYEGQRSSYKMHPGNRVLFVFQDDHTIGRFQKDHPHCASWDAENRRKAAEKPRPQYRGCSPCKTRSSSASRLQSSLRSLHSRANQCQSAVPFFGTKKGAILVCSNSSSFTFFPIPPAYPVRLPFAPTTR